MMEKIKLDIKDDIANTLLITLYAKAIESGKNTPLISDQTASDLVGRIDYDFSKFRNKTASSVGVALRAAYFDKVLKEFVQTQRKPIVVLLGCGLDAPYQRIETTPYKAVFYELDLAEVIRVREQLIPKASNENYIATSMFETAWMDELLRNHPDGNFIFIIEGVLMYFGETENRMFFNEIAKRFKGAELHFDMLNKWMSSKSKLHDTVSRTNATFKFGIKNEKDIEAWHPALKHVHTQLFQDFEGWRRMGFILTTLMSIVPVMKTSSQILKYTVQANN